MSTLPDTALHAAFSSLEKEGFTPKVECVELLGRYHVPGSTKNTILRHMLSLVWEHSRGTFDSDCIEQFFGGRHRSAVRAALMKGDFELDLTHKIPEGANVEAFRKSLKEETITPAVIAWTTRVFGHPVTQTASSSLRMVMNAQGTYERI